LELKRILSGVVDLINFRGIEWNEHDKGMTFNIVPIPADMMEEATEWRGKLLEAIAEFDDHLMEKFFENPESISEQEILAALRQACIHNKVVPMVCGSAFKNKGVQTMLDLVMELMPSPLDKNEIIGTNPDTEEEVKRKPGCKGAFHCISI
jgi:elongation factor G